MHRAISSTAMREGRRFASSTMLKRPVNARPPKVPAFLQTHNSKKNSTLALEALARLRARREGLTWSQIRAVMASAALPMVGFGFMDNFVMIQAGSYIDSTIGVKLGLATMTAAAMGQVVSDVSGVIFGGTLERFLSPWVKPANLTAAQQRLAMIPRLRLVGAVLGVITGCCLGATSLIFVLDHDSGQEVEQLKQLHHVLQDMMAFTEMKSSFCTMYVKNTKENLTAGNVAVMGLSESNEFAAECAEEKTIISDGETLYLPVLSSDGEVMAVLEIQSENGLELEETQDAERMARHVGIFMNRMWSE